MNCNANANFSVPNKPNLELGTYVHLKSTYLYLADITLYKMGLTVEDR